MAYPSVTIAGNSVDAGRLGTVNVTQALNEHWFAVITLLQTGDIAIPVEQWLGKPVEITSTDAAGATHQHFSGFVLSGKLVCESSGTFSANVTAISKSWLLAQARRKQYYPEQGLTAVANSISGRVGLKVAVQVADGKPLNYVQYGETDFALLLRIVDDHNAWMRPTADGLEVFDTFQQGATISFRGASGLGLLHFELSGTLKPASFDGAHYDFHTMASENFRKVSRPAAFYPSQAGLATAVQAKSSAVMPSGYAQQRARVMTLAQYKTSLEDESERSIGSAVTGAGKAREPAMMAGNTITLDGTFSAAGTYGLVRVEHHWTAAGYSNDFLCTPWKQFRNAEEPALRSWNGVVPARVVNHNDPAKMGRIQVAFFWQDHGNTHWARATALHAGPDRGFMFLPEVGDEVAVTFEDGDPERPVILGSLWNGVQQAPRADFRGGDIVDNDVKRMITKAGNRWQISDTPGKETFLLATPHHTRLMMTEKADETTRSLILLDSAGDIVLRAPQGRVHIQSKFFSREVGIPGAKGKAGALPIVGNQPAGKDDLCLGVNAPFADQVRAAAKRTGADPAALASFVNAEAAKNKDGSWKPDSQSSSSSAHGLMQFLAGTWKGQATQSGTALNEAAVQKGYVQGTTAANGHTTYSVVPGQESNLLAMRSDPQTSLTAGAEYLKQNQDYLSAHDLIPADATEDDKTRLGYLAHHEGAGGARQMLTGTIPDDKIDGLMDANMTKAKQTEYLKANGGDKQKAYAAFVKDYAKKQINPDQFRCSKQKP